jgi:dTDP-4-amino-4,6-dideoxygalactose transaminase
VDLTSHFYRVPLAVPYWNRGTYRRILRSFCSGSVIDGADLHNLRSLVIEGLGVKEAALCGSGSLALEIALRACDVRRGDEVVIPTDLLLQRRRPTHFGAWRNARPSRRR